MGPFLQGPVVASGGLAPASPWTCRARGGCGVVVSMGELTCGELNSNLGGMRRKDSPGTSEAVVPSKRSFSVFLLADEAASEDQSVLLLSELEATCGTDRHSAGKEGVPGVFPLGTPGFLLSLLPSPPLLLPPLLPLLPWLDVEDPGPGAGWSGVVPTVIFSVNSSSSISRASLCSGTRPALAFLYNFSQLMLTTLVLLFFNCLAQEGSGVIRSRVSLLVGSAHTIQGPDQ